MTDVGQRLQELQAQIADLRALMGGIAALGVLIVVLAMVFWSRQRRMSATLTAIWERLDARDADVVAAGAHAREEMARHRLRAERRAKARCGAGSAVPPRLPPS